VDVGIDNAKIVWYNYVAGNSKYILGAMQND